MKDICYNFEILKYSKLSAAISGALLGPNWSLWHAPITFIAQLLFNLGKKWWRWEKYSEQKWNIQLVLDKEIEIVHRLSLVLISYCVGTCRVKQKQKQTKVFTNHVGGFVDAHSGSCSK